MVKLLKNPYILLSICGLILLAGFNPFLPLSFITNPFVIIILCFIILAQCADLFVDSSVAIAQKFNIPKLIIGIFLVGLATTAPELAVSLMAAIKGNPEIALGNAIGSVICDDGLALAAVAIFSTAAIPVIPVVLKTAGIFLILINILAFAFIFPDSTLGRIEGGILLICFVIYSIYLFKKLKSKKSEVLSQVSIEMTEEDETQMSVCKVALVFLVGLTGIILSGHLIIGAAVEIAEIFHIPKTIIALTIIALGTSIPEIATCVIAAIKKEGEIAVGNIIGADILNICWVAGASAIANPLTIKRSEVLFMFPAMFIIVVAMIAMMWHKCELKRSHGFVLLGMYVVFVTVMIYLTKIGVLNEPVIST